VVQQYDALQLADTDTLEHNPTMAPTVSTKGGAAAASATSTLDLLCLLDSYDVAHGSGRTSQKAAQWKMGTARREKGGFHLGGSSTSISALNVREELRARAVVEVTGGDGTATTNSDEPPLVDEDLPSKKSKDGKREETNSLFSLHLDGIPKTQKEEEEEGGNSATGDDATLSTAISATAGFNADCNTDVMPSTTGLRLRKKNVPSGQSTTDKGEEDSKGKWTEEIPPRNASDTKLSPEELEEEKLRTANPLDLFGGLPPPPLRAAQVQAREALVRYVEAANVAAEIIRLTNEAEKGERQQQQEGGERR
jgi:hypothetical protein